jgi:hypothetical protein
MGVWSTGLYSGDFALDLRSTIRAVSRLPYDGDKLAEILCETEPAAANNPEDEDHSTFWLVAADQFAKRGILSNRARGAALKIIDSGSDIAMLGKLGMDPAGLRKRGKVLEDVRARITAPLRGKPRSVLKKPQPYLMNAGDVLSFPTCEGHCINPYFASKERDGSWKGQDGWSAAVIVDRGRAFEFLTWYRPLVSPSATHDKPAFEELQSERMWKIERPGTCSASHFKKMELEKIGEVRIDGDKLVRAFGELPSGRSAAVNDISIANSLRRALPATKPLQTIPRLSEILAG